jgi:Lipocalin-like domain
MLEPHRCRFLWCWAPPGRQLVGTWELVSTSGETADGKRMEAPFGQKPLGYLMFSPSGHFSYNWVHPDRPKFASNNRQAGSPEENQAAVHGNLSAFGTYTISPDGSLTLQIVGSSFPNWNGTTQKRTVEIGGDQMKFTSPATSVGGRAVLMLSRAK